MVMRQDADGYTRPPFAHRVGIHEMRDSFPLGRGRHHFFPKRSFNAALSSMVSASSRFSPVFSSSSVFSRMASETSIQPTELRFPFVDAGVADAVFATQMGDRNAAPCTIKIPIIYSSEKRLRFMLWSSSWARANFNLD
jgi:hypothetical protein